MLLSSHSLLQGSGRGVAVSGRVKVREDFWHISSSEQMEMQARVSRLGFVGGAAGLWVGETRRSVCGRKCVGAAVVRAALDPQLVSDMRSKAKTKRLLAVVNLRYVEEKEDVINGIMETNVLEDPMEQVRVAAYIALGHVSGAKEVPILIDGLLKDRDPGVRAAAAEALTYVTGVVHMENVLDALIESLEEDEEFIVRFSVVCAMGMLGNHRAFGTLKAILIGGKNDNLVTGAAIAAIGNLGPTTDEYLPIVTSFAKNKDDLVRRNVAVTLSVYAGYPTALATLHALADQREKRIVRDAALRSLEVAERKMGL